MPQQTESHPIAQTIMATQLPCDENGNPLDYIVGRNGITKIEASEKKGEYCMIPYIRVWAGNHCVAEFNQHKASFVRFAKTSSGG